MATQQPPDIGLDSQGRFPDAASAQAPTAFHCFGNLPAEIQLDIWDYACVLLETSPGVLCFKLDVFETDDGRVVCFTPDEYVAPSTRAHRALLRTCHTTRQKALKSLNMLNLHQLDKSNGSATEFSIPFDLEKTCFCIKGWEKYDISAGGLRGISGMGFAKRVKRVGFVVRDRDVEQAEPTGVYSRGPGYNDLAHLLLIFHNAAHVGGITDIVLSHRGSLSEGAFLSLFTFQRITFEEIVEGFLVTKIRGRRETAVSIAIDLVLEDWQGKLLAALREATWVF